MNPESPRLQLNRYEFDEKKYAEVWVSDSTEHILLNTNCAEVVLSWLFEKGLERRDFYLVVMQTSFHMSDIKYISNVADFKIAYTNRMLENIKNILEDKISITKSCPSIEERGKLSLIFGR